MGGSTPLLYATKQKKFDIVKLLIDHGADINVQNESHQIQQEKTYQNT